MNVDSMSCNDRIYCVMKLAFFAINTAQNKQSSDQSEEGSWVT